MAESQETVRHVRRDRYRDARQEREDRQETVLSAQRDRRREDRPERYVRRETVRHVQIVLSAQTDRREDVLSAKEDRDARTEAKEADSIRDLADQDRAETGEIPAGTIWPLRS